MNSYRIVFLCVACSLVLVTVAHELSHALSPWALSVFISGLPLAFAGLRLDLREGWKTVIILGLFADARAPIQFGVHALLYLGIFVLMLRLRQRLPREETLVGVVFALGANAAVTFALSAVYLWRGPAPGQMVERVLWETGLNSLLIAVLGGWFFAFVEQTLAWFGCSLRREQRGLL